MNDGQLATADDWASFYVASRHVLGTYALALTGNEHAAEDLIQEVLVRMVQHRRCVEYGLAYVLKCMRNLAIDLRRAEGRQVDTVPLEDDRIAFVDTALENLIERESMQRLADTLRSLDPGKREILVLRLYGELSFREISTVLDKPIGTVTGQYARSLKRLREWHCGDLDHERGKH